MKRVLLVTLSLLLLIGSVSAYGLYLKCPEQVQAGTPVKCSIDSDFPQGTPFTVVFSGPQTLSSESGLIPANQVTIYKVFDTEGKSSGEYSVDLKFTGTESSRLRSDAVTTQKVMIISGGPTTATATTLTTIPTAAPTSIMTQTLTTTVPTPVPTTITITTSATILSTSIITTAQTKSMESLIAEQNKKIDDQNKLIAEQNKKLSEQNDMLSQITGYLKNLFGWK
nr:hypothetical protein [uncultured Methanoregula sp.]